MSNQSFFENYIKRNELRAIKRYTYKGASVYLAEGGPYFPDNYPMGQRAELKKEFPLGWYESIYAIGRDDKIEVWQPLCFDYLHDMALTGPGRIMARVNAAKKVAEEVIDANPKLFEKPDGIH